MARQTIRQSDNHHRLSQTMTKLTNRKFTLASRPVGMPKESDFKLVEAPVLDAECRRDAGQNALRLGRSLHARAG